MSGTADCPIGCPFASTGTAAISLWLGQMPGYPSGTDQRHAAGALIGVRR